MIDDYNRIIKNSILVDNIEKEDILVSNFIWKDNFNCSKLLYYFIKKDSLYVFIILDDYQNQDFVEDDFLPPWYTVYDKPIIDNCKQFQIREISPKLINDAIDEGECCWLEMEQLIPLLRRIKIKILLNK